EAEHERGRDRERGEHVRVRPELRREAHHLRDPDRDQHSREDKVERVERVQLADEARRVAHEQVTTCGGRLRRRACHGTLLSMPFLRPTGAHREGRLVEPRTTSSTGNCRPACGPAGSSIRSMVRFAASFPNCASGWRIVVSGGETSEATKLSSNPTTEPPAGTSRPSSRTASIMPSAMRSFAQKIAVSASSRSSNSAPAFRPELILYASARTIRERGSRRPARARASTKPA